MQRIHIAIDAVSFYTLKLIYPYPLMIDYGKSLALELSQPLHWYYPVFAVCYAIALYFGRHKKIIVACTLLILVSIAPICGLMPFNFQRISIVADRYLYLTLFAVSIALAITIKNFFTPAVLTAVLIFLCCCGVLSFHYATNWKDTENLMRYTLTNNSRSKVANHNLGVALMRKGSMRQSIPYLEQAQNLAPEDITVKYDLAMSYTCVGDQTRANLMQKRVMQENPILGNKLLSALPLMEKACRTQEKH